MEEIFICQTRVFKFNAQNFRGTSLVDLRLQLLRTRTRHSLLRFLDLKLNNLIFPVNHKSCML